MISLGEVLEKEGNGGFLTQWDSLSDEFWILSSPASGDEMKVRLLAQLQFWIICESSVASVPWSQGVWVFVLTPHVETSSPGWASIPSSMRRVWAAWKPHLTHLLVVFRVCIWSILTAKYCHQSCWKTQWFPPLNIFWKHVFPFPLSKLNSVTSACCSQILFHSDEFRVYNWWNQK